MQLVFGLDWGPFSKDHEGEAQRDIFICTFSIISKLVASDGELSPKELKIIDELMKKSLKLDDEKRKFVTQVFNASRKSETAFAAFVLRYKELLSKKTEMYTWLSEVLITLSMADGVFSDPEFLLMEEFFDILSLDKEKLIQLKSSK